MDDENIADVLGTCKQRLDALLDVLTQLLSSFDKDEDDPFFAPTILGAGAHVEALKISIDRQETLSLRLADTKQALAATQQALAVAEQARTATSHRNRELNEELDRGREELDRVQENLSATMTELARSRLDLAKSNGELNRTAQVSSDKGEGEFPADTQTTGEVWQQRIAELEQRNSELKHEVKNKTEAEREAKESLMASQRKHEQETSKLRETIRRLEQEKSTTLSGSTHEQTDKQMENQLESNPDRSEPTTWDTRASVNLTQISGISLQTAIPSRLPILSRKRTRIEP
ncbi:hypothetical protein PV08_11731 [Exophiala spinifera]|uniref:Uncharacterized protein n=1 Tax=Exophiala spinifera TaxID=91928 RepID=A0A0D2AU09_9EURO|nr:uncharacterized protein PV08_11731 [Exophiala spinifera]KIW09955.1 hypothetical protein PV08_11731 [Exophiala spinifera]